MTNAFFLTVRDTEAVKLSVVVLFYKQRVTQYKNGGLANPVDLGDEETDGLRRNSDALFIQEASPVELTYEVNPYTFKEPVSLT